MIVKAPMTPEEQKAAPLEELSAINEKIQEAIDNGESIDELLVARADLLALVSGKTVIGKNAVALQEAHQPRSDDKARAVPAVATAGSRSAAKAPIYNARRTVNTPPRALRASTRSGSLCGPNRSARQRQTIP